MIRQDVRSQTQTPSQNVIKDLHRYAEQVSDTTMLPIAASLFGQKVFANYNLKTIKNYGIVACHNTLYRYILNAQSTPCLTASNHCAEVLKDNCRQGNEPY